MNDVKSNVLVLCAKLREDGFERHAANLETKLLSYIKASSAASLYNIQDETGEELLELAHPEGSVEIIPAKDDNGLMMGQLDQHKKILLTIKSASFQKDKNRTIKMVMAALNDSE